MFSILVQMGGRLRNWVSKILFVELGIKDEYCKKKKKKNMSADAGF